MDEKAVKEVLSATSGIPDWFFAMRFVSIDLSTKFEELLKIGGRRPAIVFMTAQACDVLVTLFTGPYYLEASSFHHPSRQSDGESL